VVPLDRGDIPERRLLERRSFIGKGPF